MVEPPTRDPFLSIFHSCAAQIPQQHCSEPSCLDFFRNRQTSSMSNSCLHQETSSSISVEVWNASNLNQVPQLDPVPLIFQSQVKLRSKHLKVSQVSCWLMLWGLPKTIPQRIRFLKLDLRTVCLQGYTDTMYLDKHIHMQVVSKFGHSKCPGVQKIMFRMIPWPQDGVSPFLGANT